MRQKNIKDELKRWSGMSIYGLTSREFSTSQSRLSDILQKNVPQRFYLSRKACLGILRRASARGKALPEILKKALEQQAERMRKDGEE